MGRWAGLLAGGVLALQGFAASAQEVSTVVAGGTPPMWDCWISDDSADIISYSIRCINDQTAGSGGRTTSSTNTSTNTSAGIVPGPLDDALGHVRRRLRAGEILALDQDLVNGLGEALYGHLWSIRIHQYPYEDSWQAGRPQELVRATLCPTSPACPVVFHH